MGLFNRIFGGRKPVIDGLLSGSDEERAIMEIDEYIGERCGWGDSMDRLTGPQRNFFYNQNLERELNNGGFSQFFMNASGSFAQETLIALDAIGAGKTAEILRMAMGKFPDASVPKDRAERRRVVEAIEEGEDDAWEQLDKLFYLYEDDLNGLNLDYIRRHRDAF